ncbi:MAG TPA: c-type cytochrome [Candidatus Cybelea sp.]|nr:c-type cytochrome [Candidatus Cybelea sp.]
MQHAAPANGCAIHADGVTLPWINDTLGSFRTVRIDARMMIHAIRIAQFAVLAAVTVLLAAEAGAAGASGPMLAQNCLACHGSRGQGQGAIPKIAGMSAADILTALHDFRTGKRSATIMRRVAEGYTPDEDERLAAYLATLK